MRVMRTLPVLLLAFAACGSVSTSHDFDPDADFTKLRTYKWLDAPPAPNANPEDNSPLVLKRVRNAVDAQLAAKGYKRVESGSDFQIEAHLSSKQRTRVTSTGYSGPYRYGYWGGQDIDVYQYEEGSLVLDIVNSAGKQLIWRGVARAAIPDNPQPDEITKIVNEAAEKLIARFPPN